MVNRFRFCWYLAFAAAIIGMHAIGLSAQPEQRTSAATFRSSVDIVAVPVTVQTRTGGFVRDISQDRFHVFENGIEQPITVLASGEVPVDLVLLIDTSASMSRRLADAQHAAGVLVGSLSARDRASVVSFGGRVVHVSELTTDRAALDAALRKLDAGGQTPLYDAVYIAMNEFAHEGPQSELRRRAFVVLSDGDDTASHVSFDSVLGLARQIGVAIYTVVLDAPSMSPYQQSGVANYEMKTLAHETGAQSFFARTTDNLDRIYASIAQELANQYSVGYVPKSRVARAFVRVTVTVDHANGMVRARTGYVAAN